MIRNVYTVGPGILDSEDTASNEIIVYLNKLGYKRQPGQFGGGPGEIKEIIVTWISLHPLLTGLFINIIANRIDALLVFFYKWFTRNKPVKKLSVPFINIYVYPEFWHKKSYHLKMRIDKKYTKKEIIEAVKKAKKINLF